MRESDIESYLRRLIEGIGGLCLKFTSPNRRNVPDRIVLVNPGIIVFVELKAPGRKATAGQLREHERLRALGFQVFVFDSKEDCKRLPQHLKEEKVDRILAKRGLRLVQQKERHMQILRDAILG